VLKRSSENPAVENEQGRQQVLNKRKARRQSLCGKKKIKNYLTLISLEITKKQKNEET